MPALQPIVNGDDSHYKAIANAKRGLRKTRLLNVWSDIEKRYDEYARLAPNLEQLAQCSLSLIRQRDCRHCYDVPTAPLSSLLKQVGAIVPANQSILCQYCLIGELDTIDHYVPKSIFPEFSVLPRNLVPSCPKCNRLKKDIWLQNGERAIFNLYYDNIPNDNYLHATVTFPYAKTRANVSFKLMRPAGWPDAMFNKVLRHFACLKLIERYDVAGAEYVSEAVAAVKAMDDQSSDWVSNHFRRNAANLSMLYGSNYWKSILAVALANNNDFLAFIR